MADSSMMGGLASGFTDIYNRQAPYNPNSPFGATVGNQNSPFAATVGGPDTSGAIGAGLPFTAPNPQNVQLPRTSTTTTADMMGSQGITQNTLTPLLNNFGNMGSPVAAQQGGAAPTDFAQTNPFLTQTYQRLLGRAPDVEGFNFWNQALQNGLSQQDLIRQFQESPEFKGNAALSAASMARNPFGIQPTTPSTDPYTQAAQQTALANLQSAQQAVTANRVNQITPYSNLQYEQTGTDANGNPIWTARQSVAPTLQPGLQALQGRVAQTAGQEFNPQTPSVGINPGETYSDAIMRRLQPELQRQTEALDVRLANQGIMPGSEAYNRAKTQQAQRQNDLLTAAQVGGINVGLTANQQAYNQALQRYNLPLTQLGAFQQATQPGYINPPAQATVAAPDYLGAYTTNQAAQIAAQNANAARQANLTSGLFGLGAAGLLGGGGIPGLINAGRGLAGLFSSTPSSSGFLGLDPSYAAQLGLYGGSGLDTAGAAGDVLSGLF